MQHYRRKDWAKFRAKVIELDGGSCVRCRRGVVDGVVLQVHHKEYLPGKMPWEYPYELCETLCKGCHAGEHGIVRPFDGWVCVGYDDLEDLSGECDVCGNSIRYVYFVQHEKWPSLEVGEVCCDHLTDTSEASDHADGLRRFQSRQQRFVSSSRWELQRNGALFIRQKGVELFIEPIGQDYRLRVDGLSGKKQFRSIVDAKKFAFARFEDGTIDAYLRRQRARR